MHRTIHGDFSSDPSSFFEESVVYSTKRWEEEKNSVVFLRKNFTETKEDNCKAWRNLLIHQVTDQLSCVELSISSVPVLRHNRQLRRAPDHLVQGPDALPEGGSAQGFVLPALQHKLVNEIRTFL